MTNKEGRGIPPAASEPDDSKLEVSGLPQAEYGELYRKHFFQQYEVAVRMADHISQRRATANDYYLGISAVILTVIALASQRTLALVTNPWPVVGAVVALGEIVAAAWYLQIRAYRRLNRAKCEVIIARERALPARLHEAEDQASKARRRGEKLPYLSLTTLEAVVPFAFGIVYILIPLAPGIVSILARAIWG